MDDYVYYCCGQCRGLFVEQKLLSIHKVDCDGTPKDCQFIAVERFQNDSQQKEFIKSLTCNQDDSINNEKVRTCISSKKIGICIDSNNEKCKNLPFTSIDHNYYDNTLNTRNALAADSEIYIDIHMQNELAIEKNDGKECLKSVESVNCKKLDENDGTFHNCSENNDADNDAAQDDQLTDKKKKVEITGRNQKIIEAVKSKTFEHSHENKVAKCDEKKKKKTSKLQNNSKKDNEDEFDMSNVEVVIEADKVGNKHRYYVCDICRHKTKHRGFFIRHRKCHSQDGQLFKCKLCDYSSLFQGQLNNHIYKKHDKQLLCQYCSYRTSNHRDLQRHMWRHTGEAPFKCDIPGCGYACRQERLLVDHQRKHTGELLKCNYEGCNFSTQHQTALKFHEKRKHDDKDLKVYICGTCGYSTKTRVCFTRHMKVHLGIKDHKCPLCDYAACTSSDVQRHLRIHTNDKVYHCDHCPFKSKHYSGLRFHIISQHSELCPFSCSNCNYSAPTKQKVDRHISQRHKGETAVVVKKDHLKIPIHINPNKDCQEQLKSVKLSFKMSDSLMVAPDASTGCLTPVNIQEIFLDESPFESDHVIALQCEHCSFVCHSSTAMTLHKLNFHVNGTVQVVGNKESTELFIQSQIK